MKYKHLGFKPYYKWMTFNTISNLVKGLLILGVLNLIINGWPSILDFRTGSFTAIPNVSFKPYYKWMTFNTWYQYLNITDIQGFKPYYKWMTFNTKKRRLKKWKEYFKTF